MPPNDIEFTVLFPCLNEAATIGKCVNKAVHILKEARLRGEILVADNGSSDGSAGIAHDCGARVVDVVARGYGAALRAGIENAAGRFVIFADADESYCLDQIPEILQILESGCELVIGNRFANGIERGAMPWLNRYVGNPVLSGIGRCLFKSPFSDWHCGLRGVDRQAILAIGLESCGMEFASEMIIKASIHRLKMAEIATSLRRDGRDHPPHLRPLRDGFRHLRLMLGLKWKQLKNRSEKTMP
jgi:glycosyltransferase involved in cell wall biosynthesis